jgi:hypothetical protein
MNELSIILPCVSTVDTLQDFVDQLAIYLMSNPSEIDVIVVANEDIPSTEKLVNYVQKKYPWLKFELLIRSGTKRNYGALARFGIAYSTSRYVVLVSPYGDNDLCVINLMLKKIRKGYQVVQATSNLSNGNKNSKQKMFNIYRLIFRFLARIMIGVKIKSTTNTFKMFDRVFVQALGLTRNTHSICPEITFKVLLAGGKLKYLSSNSKITPVNTDFKLFKEGVDYFLLLIRGFMHRIGIQWF